MSCEANAKACFLFNNPFAFYLVACWSGRIKYLSLDIIVFFQSCTNLSLYYVCVQLHLVTTPLLKFMAEFVLNKAQRLTFDSSSPNGILLFREVSKLIVAYGSRILSLPNVADIYAFKYKGIWISLTILTRGETMNLLFLVTVMWV